MDKGEIKAVFFDIGNVLLQFDLKEILRKIAAVAGTRPLRVARLLWARDLVDGIERGEITASELYAIFESELGYKCEFGEFVNLWCDHFTLNKKSANLLRRAGERADTYLLSNTNRLHYEFIASRYAFPGYVKSAVLSYELGLRKPEAGIYEAALRTAGVRPEQAFFVDDLKENVEGAAKLGIRAVRFRSADILEAEMQALGII